MNDGAGARQQIVEKIRQSANILVTVGTDPSVDELSAALGLTIMINSLDKHATAVVSGAIPPAIDFLEPGKTFENTVDSLRDFIIALDKEKADHLRYKVEGDVVKIFITPYRTVITEDDLDFTQGDYNVELVLALGVESEEHLDKALESHGRILHDATVATISNTSASKLGSIDWYDQNASSISEMLVSLAESLKTDKGLLDEQIATAFLTGIVASTDRFSNNKTSSKVMTMAAQLMAAGANQQLIAAKLEDAHAISSNDSQPANSDGSTSLSEGESSKVKKDTAVDKKVENKEKNDGTLSIAHEPIGNLDEVANEVREKQHQEATERAEDALAKQLKSVAPLASSVPSVDDLRSDIAAASAEIDKAADTHVVTPATEASMPGYEPTLGGTLNATTEQAADDKRREAENDQNKTILSHGVPSLPQTDGPVFASTPFNAASHDDRDYGAASIPEPASPNASPAPLPPLPSFDTSSAPAATQTLADIDRANRGSNSDTGSHDDALAAVHAAYNDGGEATTPAVDTALPSLPQPAAPGASQLPPLPDFSTLPPVPESFTTATGAFVPPAPTSEPEQLGQTFQSTPSTPPSQVNDPGQFKIPGQ